MFSLALTAELNGVTNLRPVDTEDSPFWYTFTVQCTSCRETHPNPVAVNRFVRLNPGIVTYSTRFIDKHQQEANELSGSRGEANFVWKCKNCKRESSASIKLGPKPYEQAEPAKQQSILEFDCRGLEFTHFSPEGEWLADATDSGTKFEGIDCLGEGEWFEYDEKANEEVSIKDVKWEIRRA
ncbi:CXXC motif-containing zinc binding protein [Microdochium nivale]|nr:CXXC motif-containing zinc binding protein [Microdochium nivale]